MRWEWWALTIFAGYAFGVATVLAALTLGRLLDRLDNDWNDQ